jgi:predicted transcriptional regulator
MKKLIILLAFLLPVLITKSQVVISPETAKKLTKELVTCDSIKAVHSLTKKELQLTQSKVKLKDSIIGQYIIKDSIYQEMLHNEELKFDAQSELVHDLEKANKKLKVRHNFTKVISGIVTVTLTILTLIK